MKYYDKYIKYKKKYLNIKKKEVKLIGGGEIQEITENNKEIEFEQRKAVINYGIGPISTYNLVNCIAIGGVFKLFDERYGTFLTHESPIDYLELQNKLTQIKQKLDEKQATITNIIIFRIDEPATDVYKNGLTTTDIIKEMITFSYNLFKLNPIISIYSCDISTYRCGKALISPNEYISSLTNIRDISNEIENPVLSIEPSGTFTVDILNNKNGDKIYRCPFCKNVSGTLAPIYPTDISLFHHNLDCPNKNKIPKEE